jgi:hypothetical protein
MTQLYEYAPKITKVIDYGIPAEDVLSGRTPPPPEGARVDVYFEGPVTGNLRGRVKGVDYLLVRADGRVKLDIHAEITTDDEKRIALVADGVAIPVKGSSTFELRENVTMTTSHPEYLWLNALQIWAPGTVDLRTGEIRVKGYTAEPA